MARNYYQGRFVPKFPQKYAGNHTNIIYRSSWELHMMRWCDQNPNILEWSSEETVIPYLFDIDQKMHRYYVDLKIKIRNKDNEVETYLIEIKPSAQTKKPVVDKINKKTEKKIFEWVKNQNKWKAAEEYAAQRGWKFRVLTEHEIGIKH